MNTYTCTCILQASFPQDEHFSRGIPCPSLQVCLNTCPNLDMSVCAWHWWSTFVQLHDKSQEWRNGGHRLWSCFWVSYTGQHWFSLLVSFSYSILWARYTVHYLGGMNKSNEDTWIYILDMNEPGIKPNNVNPTLFTVPSNSWVDTIQTDSTASKLNDAATGPWFDGVYHDSHSPCTEK